MDINSDLVRTKNATYVAFQQLNLTFTTLNGKNFKISNTTSSPMKLIYKIIDWTRGVQNFDYGFSGYGEITDYREKIDEYLKYGYKDIIGKQVEIAYKYLSIILFIMGSLLILPFKNIFTSMDKDPWIGLILIPFLVFILISFIFDIILVVDKIRDNNSRGHNGKFEVENSSEKISDKFMLEKISIWHILIFKVVILIILFFMCFAY